MGEKQNPRPPTTFGAQEFLDPSIGDDYLHCRLDFPGIYIYTIEVVVATIAKMVKLFLDDNKLTLTIQSGGSLITSHKPTYQKWWQRTCREHIYIYCFKGRFVGGIFFCSGLRIFLCFFHNTMAIVCGNFVNFFFGGL